MIPTYAFLFIAIGLAIVVGRAGTILREYLEARSASIQHQQIGAKHHTRDWRVKP